ncbi:MAG: 50S ribosomal protein L19 [Candidatus Taylorbacteria bacterium RIFCSPLOWO2_12_FULL_43_20]|uniref:50S ribosomal protein L19 n=1 Tax=Candidatus Taylorbacteria bacterium RIFCSPLOWO2_12_FULL_43_20 TaxID=1802332 RepID=A0A1G2NZR4_9BACT|nr:MAG: 50S ribosomal protein L19 [Candidatus Taylorbacteria bacterium RIFCSPHIGHO2_02_FULL_43_55]OHA28142.1 MAG: 50S ribosomal protein L19 [Candidatus Taylorbacteria bacterium RIFCSPHIGHO2_12_FULL_42_34]OHA32351.1 MAG: 50S ribosomal protein L19 [Candidatus Taylorbacteria bacterium RIFCSPLOWO2_01_FULL_43_83]OHA37692.1 MAG: 50S ribosomal protein L19 [Candidatus Taylorbacteria bacterium RIFCSPLOWO2_02_FULL_43_22b]OHA41584.1 MAG: 50S ribosomal protein L19 [Candidatus Taylorbacteria bacterium RIFCS
MDERKGWNIKAGDTIKVWQKIKEKDKYRLQMFDGLVLAVKHGTTAGGTFTVRKVASGVGVEKIFPLYSPLIDRIEITKRAKVRQAKLYHIRRKAAKEIQREMRNLRKVEVRLPKETEDKTEEENKETAS